MGNITPLPFVFDLDLAYSAQAFRQPFEGILNEGAEGIYDALVVAKGGTGVNPDAGGGVRNNTVDTLPGWAWVLGDVAPNTDGIYRVWIDTTQNDAVTNNSTGSTRNDSVVLEVLDTPTYVARTRIIAGASGGGLATIPNNCLELARLAIPNGFTGASVITASMITDVRPRNVLDSRFSKRLSGASPGADVRMTTSATTDVLTSTFTLPKAQRAIVGAQLAYLADPAGGANGLLGACLLIDGVLDPYGFGGTVNVAQSPNVGSRGQIVIPAHPVDLAAGTHTIKLQGDRDANNVIDARGMVTFNGRNYIGTTLSIVV